MASQLTERLADVISRYDLLQHPFYVAWSEGTLPVEALKSYASEYGNFIGRVGAGWRAFGEETIAVEEDEHAVLWGEFAQALGTQVQAPKVAEVTHLTNTVDGYFADPVTARGALYAFEAQQPFTSASKLEGLDTHYTALGAEVRPYFEIHVNDTAEPALILEQLNTLSEGEQDRAVAACEDTCKALYDALSGIYAPFAPAHACE
jgi:pyrroloquinoline-quinone synthase